MRDYLQTWSKRGAFKTIKGEGKHDVKCMQKYIWFQGILLILLISGQIFGKAKAKIYNYMKNKHNSKVLSSLILENLSSGQGSIQILPSLESITN